MSLILKELFITTLHTEPPSSDLAYLSQYRDRPDPAQLCLRSSTPVKSLLGLLLFIVASQPVEPRLARGGSQELSVERMND